MFPMKLIMNKINFIHNIRQEVREEGFIPVNRVYVRIEELMKEHKINFDVKEIIDNIPCVDIKVLKYSSWIVGGFRYKKLFYFEAVVEQEVSCINHTDRQISHIIPDNYCPVCWIMWFTEGYFESVNVDDLVKERLDDLQMILDIDNFDVKLKEKMKLEITELTLYEYKTN